MSSPLCHICNKDLMYSSNNQIYCSKGCYKIGKATKQRIINQRRYMISPKKCKRCLETKTEQGMKAHCKSCVLILKGPKMKKCATCHENNIQEKSTYCKPCLKDRRLAQMKEHHKVNNTRKPCRACGCKIGKDIKPQERYCSDKCKAKGRAKVEVLTPKVVTRGRNKQTKEINPYWLNRGPISNNSQMGLLDGN